MPDKHELDTVRKEVRTNPVIGFAKDAQDALSIIALSATEALGRVIRESDPIVLQVASEIVHA